MGKWRYGISALIEWASPARGFGRRLVMSASDDNNFFIWSLPDGKQMLATADNLYLKSSSSCGWPSGNLFCTWGWHQTFFSSGYWFVNIQYSLILTQSIIHRGPSSRPACASIIEWFTQLHRALNCNWQNRHSRMDGGTMPKKQITFRRSITTSSTRIVAR